jgi:RHS repeat-associated protein
MSVNNGVTTVGGISGGGSIGGNSIGGGARLAVMPNLFPGSLGGGGSLGGDGGGGGGGGGGGASCPIPKPNPGPGPCVPNQTASPIRYWNGAVVLSSVDVAAPDGGFLTHQRSYNNQTQSAHDGPNGFNWFLSDMPYAIADGTSIAVVFDPNHPLWFNLVSGVYVPQYATPGMSLVHNALEGTLTLTTVQGTDSVVTVFRDLDDPDAPGQFAGQSDARGISTVVTTSGNRIVTLTREYAAGPTTSDWLSFEYHTTGSSAGCIEYVTYNRHVSSDEAIQRVQYNYYGTMDANGSVRDLKTAKQQQYNTTTSTWDTVSVSYYRYYLSGSMVGFKHGLKMAFGPEAYRQMFNDGIDIETATDSVVKPYADQYFEYDPTSQAVTKEVSAVCAGCPGGGTTSDEFAYTPNPRTPTDGYNVWSVKTVQTLPDGAKTIAYNNYAGQMMLKVYVDSGGSNQWINFYLYDDDGYVIWEAEPSAVTGYDDTYDDLLHKDSMTGLYEYLRDDDGLINITDYYTSTDIPSGEVKGYMSALKIRKGQSGSDVFLESYAYTSQTAGDVTLYPIQQVDVYPDATSTTTKITTTYAYEWYPSTTLLQQQTTTLPAVLTGQNGSGVSATIIEQYDQQQNLTQWTDERGTITTYAYDVLPGTLIQVTLNFSASWSTLSVDGWADMSVEGWADLTVNPAENINLAVDFTYDGNGRLIQALGPPFTADLAGTATTVRKAAWNVYLPTPQPVSGSWDLDQQWTGYGYATGTDPSYTFTLIDPTTIVQADKSARVINWITSKRSSGSGALSASDTFDQTDWKSWSSIQYNDRGQRESSRIYYDIPSSGEGLPGTSYGETDYGYDALERLNRIVAPGGTITRMVWTAPQRLASIWAGTDDTGASDSNPAGSGSPNNMVVVTEYEYDDGDDGGDGNVTQITQYAAASDTRITSYGYDWRDRQISQDGEVDIYAEYIYDNLDRLTQMDRKDTTAMGDLIGRSDVVYDDRGRICQTFTYAVDPTTGTPGNALTTNRWYDDSGNLIMQITAGHGVMFIKMAYNAMGWMTATYRGYNLSGSGYSEAIDLTNDTLVNQVLYTYDDAGNQVSQANCDRLNDATGTGPLSEGTQPKARISYMAMWYDGMGRTISTANYGAISSFTRPDVTPSPSDTVLVSTNDYDDAGRLWKTVDPAGIENHTAFDDAGRTTQTIEAYDSGSMSDDTNRTTNYTYTLDNQVETIEALNDVTGDQTTTYTYGTTLSDSGVARNDLLQSVTYPDSVSGSDEVSYTYNRQGKKTTITDQRGTIRTLIYDKLGRQTDDCVTNVGTETDSAVLRISTAYEVRGMVETLTSYDNATPGSGTVLNQVERTYNDFSQLIEEAQDHAGSVSGSSPNVQYSYDSGDSDSNEVRPTGITYPDSRAITSDYGSSGGMNDALNRIQAIKDSTTSLAGYLYLGADTVIRIDYSEPTIRLDLWGGTSGTFNGFDRFGRIISQDWYKGFGLVHVIFDAYAYGYDRSSNRIWKSRVAGTNQDEYYSYDPLNRLTQMQRGTLNSTKTGITGTPVIEQDWTLDPTGNWPGYLTKASGTTDLNQTRTQNTVNEITAISASGGTPVWAAPTYDAAGNMTTFPQGDDPTQAYTAVYDAWNRLVSVSDDTPELVGEYQYDGGNWRTVKKTYVSGILNETRHFYYTNQWQDVEERVGSSTSADLQYVWGIRYIDELICRDDSTPRRLYATQDANFNLTSICNTSGAVVESYVFDPYGNRTIYNASGVIISSSAYDWTIENQGLICDVETGLIYNRARYLHPALGRWMQSDPIGYRNGMNSYEDKMSSPINWVDPYGTQAAPIVISPNPTYPIFQPGFGAPTPTPTPTPTPLPAPEAGIGIGVAVGVGAALVGIWYDAQGIYQILDGENYINEIAAQQQLLNMQPCRRQRAQQDPFVLPRVNPGRGKDGTCNPCPPDSDPWYVDAPHGGAQGHWHQIQYNQAPDCTCYPDRWTGDYIS